MTARNIVVVGGSETMICINDYCGVSTTNAYICIAITDVTELTHINKIRGGYFEPIEDMNKIS